jgi:hypothetical protein
MRIESWLKSVARGSWVLRREKQGLREMLQSRTTGPSEDDLDEARLPSSLPLPRQSGFAGSGT